MKDLTELQETLTKNLHLLDSYDIQPLIEKINKKLLNKHFECSIDISQFGLGQKMTEDINFLIMAVGNKLKEKFNEFKSYSVSFNYKLKQSFRYLNIYNPIENVDKNTLSFTLHDEYQTDLFYFLNFVCNERLTDNLGESNNIMEKYIKRDWQSTNLYSQPFDISEFGIKIKFFKNKNVIITGLTSDQLKRFYYCLELKKVNL